MNDLEINYEKQTTKILIGSCIERINDLPDNYFQCCVTSPPYYGLRDYGHVDQIGKESSPAEFVTNLVNVFESVKNKLKDNGTLWVNLGDSYWSKSSELLLV